jgi:hypothetical protein
MKKICILLTVALLGVMSAQAQSSTLKSVLGALSSAASSTTTTSTSSSSSTTSGLSSLLGGVLSNVLSTDKVSTDDMVGTWTYSSPAVKFESENLLLKAGGTAASTTVQNKLAKYYKTLGFTSMTLTVTSDKQFTLKTKRLSLSGTLEQGTNDGEIIFNFTALGTVPVGSYTAHVSISGSTMSFTFDASKMMALINTVSTYAGNSTLSTLNTLLQQYDGMKVGFTMKKK